MQLGEILKEVLDSGEVIEYERYDQIVKLEKDDESYMLSTKQAGTDLYFGQFRAYNWNIFVDNVNTFEKQMKDAFEYEKMRSDI